MQQGYHPGKGIWALKRQVDCPWTFGQSWWVLEQCFMEWCMLNSTVGLVEIMLVVSDEKKISV